MNLMTTVSVQDWKKRNRSGHRGMYIGVWSSSVLILYCLNRSAQCHFHRLISSSIIQLRVCQLQKPAFSSPRHVSLCFLALNDAATREVSDNAWMTFVATMGGSTVVEKFIAKQYDITTIIMQILFHPLHRNYVLGWRSISMPSGQKSTPRLS